ncbi:uncharacterized protein N7515_010227 [Penicillium bovifimosum]|uniref:Protein kinase domain-containing protein n=1 Tax=Penicillium bovifimosum TaxID=126998 RepID=A0A9W9GJ74_9EURO|nr:uncharacterized protein N7515_010227 [Penicillium bovifimosum]KAJ5120839.1 hypothetical protein N7515_010227 [Penicillium bovifimosum]
MARDVICDTGKVANADFLMCLSFKEIIKRCRIELMIKYVAFGISRLLTLVNSTMGEMGQLEDWNDNSLTAIADNKPNRQCGDPDRHGHGLSSERHGLPHPGHPTQKYSMNWKVDQAGCGWLSLGNYFGYSTVLIKKKTADKKHTSVSKLQVALHTNIVGLVEAFYDSKATYLVYNYHGFAVSLSQVGSTPAVQLSEIDLASICRSVLKGLEYIHEELLIVHGRIDCDNIILCSDGGIKIAWLMMVPGPWS